MLSLVETFDPNHRQYTVSFRRLVEKYQPFKYPRYAKRVTYSTQVCLVRNYLRMFHIKSTILNIRVGLLQFSFRSDKGLTVLVPDL